MSEVILVFGIFAYASVAFLCWMNSCAPDERRAFGHAILWPLFSVRWIAEAIIIATKDLFAKT